MTCVAGPTSGGPEPTLRIDEEDARRDDLFSSAEAFAYFNLVGQACPEANRAGLEHSGRHDDEDVLLVSGVHDRIARHRQSVSRLDPELCRPIDTGTE